MGGTVTSYNRRRCWGYITGDDGYRYFLHRSAITGPAVQHNDRVEFVPVGTRRGPKACAVRPLGAALAPPAPEA